MEVAKEEPSEVHAEGTSDSAPVLERVCTPRRRCATITQTIDAGGEEALVHGEAVVAVAADVEQEMLAETRIVEASEEVLTGEG